MSVLTKRLPAISVPAKATLPLALLGALIIIGASFLPWTWDPALLGNVTIAGYPAPIQILIAILGALAAYLAIAHTRAPRLLPRWVDSAGALRALGWGLVAVLGVAILCIALMAGGLINVDPGGWLALVGAGLVLLSGTSAATKEYADPLRARHRDWVEILVVVLLLAAGLASLAFGLAAKDGALFLTFLALLAAIAFVLTKAGFFQWLTVVAARHRQVLMLGALAVAFLFPLTQGGSDANMSIATQVLIFATTALGLNVVVGLAGLLDLGYVAFLGAGAYTAAMMSSATAATIGWKPPFLVVALIGACVSAVLGLIIGSPTLRVSGDYLAIVTLAFGEIFRISVNNLDGSNGPDLTHGPNGIPAIPDLTLFGFDFGSSHEIFGITLTRYTNYYMLLLLLAIVVITIFSRLNSSRIGRGWVAIREDERAAEAMGVNVFGLKLLAFAGGAFLAGLAGAVKAHQDIAVTPSSYAFLESAFLLAAVVLGGMGTVLGVIIGATILKLLPEKLRFLSDYRLLIFGILLVVMMRFRPEGLVPSTRRQLEFHEDDDELAISAQDSHLEKTAEATA